MNTGAVALRVVCEIIAKLPVPPSIAIEQTVEADGRGFAKASVIVVSWPNNSVTP